MERLDKEAGTALLWPEENFAERRKTGGSALRRQHVETPLSFFTDATLGSVCRGTLANFDLEQGYAAGPP